MTEGPSIVQRRIAIMALGCVLAFTLIGVRLVDLTLIRHSPATLAVLPPRAAAIRADITDRNGELLARDLVVHDLSVQPYLLSDRKVAAHQLAIATGTDEQRLLKSFAGHDKPNQFVLVARQVTPEVEDTLTDLGIEGLEFDPAMKRYYPRGGAAAQVLGATDADGKGITGIELGLNKQLHGGHPAELSLDMRIQYALTHEIDAARSQFNAKAAGGIIINVNTGEIVGMASQRDPSAVDEEDRASPDRNRMLRDVYELGSVFKIFAFTLAMQDHTTRLDEWFPIGHGFKVGRYTIHDAERMPASLMAKDIFAQSSNAGTAQIALRSGPQRQQAFLRSLGLLSPVRSEDPEGAKPLFPRRWGTTETATVGFGHGISVSPLSFVTAAAIVVNGGRRVTPTLLKQAGDRRGEQVISPETSATMRGLLRYVVTDGTGKLADVPGYNVGGKTGSAEKATHGRYVAHKLLTSFCAVFPIDNPRYLVFVLLDEPHGANASGVMALAGHTAAPLAGRVVAKIAPMLEMPTQAPAF
ncbi:MAG TPA: penicillin-binding protein 2 [Rhizomicrobium sp.]|jgi:cell division protein FtsI (penicillin-binding protein 3)|nr:penicillin-binding protein 2 [Rhizomicrobium sp.]